METLLLTWINHCTDRHIPLSQMIIQTKAKSLYDGLLQGNSNGKFKASRGWFDRFRKRANISNVALSGESASADTLAAENYSSEIKKIVEEGSWSPKQIFNVDETGLFWKKMPKRTYVSRQSASAPGHKAAKERISILLGGNAAGDFKFKPYLIYHSENPRAFKNCNKNQLGVHWRANRKAWMTSVLFVDWIKNCCIPEIKNYCDRENLACKALVLIDNAPSHPLYINDIDDNIKFFFSASEYDNFNPTHGPRCHSNL